MLSILLSLACAANPATAFDPVTTKAALKGAMHASYHSKIDAIAAHTDVPQLLAGLKPIHKQKAVDALVTSFDGGIDQAHRDALADHYRADYVQPQPLGAAALQQQEKEKIQNSQDFRGLYAYAQSLETTIAELYQYLDVAGSEDAIIGVLKARAPKDEGGNPTGFLASMVDMSDVNPINHSLKNPEDTQKLRNL